MSLLSQASLVVVPSGYKEDVVYSVKPTDGSGDLTFTRASDGTRVNSQGLVERVPWNLLQQSNTFSTSPWGLTSNITLTSGQTGYDGSSNAWLLARIDTSARYVYQNVSFDNNQYTCSVYAKAANNDWLFLYCYTGSGGVNQYYDLANGATGTSGGGFTSSSIESVGNGWYRCTMTFTTPVTIVRIYPAVGDGSITGGVSDASLYIQDAQLNEGSTAKPYFPTTDRLNVPRLDYSNGCPSLLLEPQRTNVFTYSESFDNAAWTKQDATITANAAISPDGTQNADLYTTSSDLYDFVRQTISFTSGTTYTYSVFAKAGTSSLVTLGYSNVAFSSGPTVEFDLSNGTYTVYSGSPSVKMKDYGNGWYHCSITDTATTTASRTTGFSSSASGAVTTLYLWGAQLEVGAYPTSYIPTTSASVTRVADAAYKTGISSLIGSATGTAFIDIQETNNSSGTTNTDILLLQNNANNASGTYSLFLHGSTGNLRVYFLPENISVTMKSGNNRGQRLKIAFAYSSGDFVCYVNGVQVYSASRTLCTGLDKFELNASPNYGLEPVNQAALFKTRLTNAELAALTTL